MWDLQLCARVSENIENFLYMQEAKGLVVSLLVKGVQFECDDEADGFGLTPVPPIPLQAMLLTGEVSADGLTPIVGPTRFRRSGFQAS